MKGGHPGTESEVGGMTGACRREEREEKGSKGGYLCMGIVGSEERGEGRQSNLKGECRREKKDLSGVYLSDYTFCIQILFIGLRDLLVSKRTLWEDPSIVLRFQHFSAQTSAYPFRYHPILPTLPDNHPISPIYLFLFLYLPIIPIFSYITLYHPISPLHFGP